MRHWMFLTHPDNWERCLSHSLFGFDNEYTYTIEHYVSPGDHAIIYLANDSAIWGIVEIEEVRLNQTEDIGWVKKGWVSRKRRSQLPGFYPVRVRFRTVCQVRPPRVIGGANNEFRNQLEYITDKRRWNVFVQTALCRVPEADVETVRRWAGATAGEPRDP